MKKIIVLFSVVYITLTGNTYAQESLIIQEGEPGVCTMDGVIDSTSNAILGSTGIGIANIDNGIGIGMSWSFEVTTPGTYKVIWRYGLGGSNMTSRDGKLLVNNVSTDTILFPHTGDWILYEDTDTAEVELVSGLNKIRLSSVTVQGLANLDYIKIIGSGLTPSGCTPSYLFNLQANDPVAGSVEYTPVQDYYDLGDEITLTATANSGYFFHSWSGIVSDTINPFTFTVNRNTNVTALFYPNGTTTTEGANGYAVVQHDNGTPYLLTGGYEGSTVHVDNLEDLKMYLSSNDPYVVILDAHLQGVLTDEIKIASNKTLIGGNEYSHIEGIKVSLENSRNVIVKNMTFSKVLRGDLFEINSNSKNVWIDHCEFFTDRDHDYDEDYYDGMLDIKNESSFITVSWSNFHDHNKGILITSGDQATYDTVQRITFHHNYFHRVNARLPSIRFGKSHIFNNYYEECGTAINSRMHACVRVEKNYFLNAGTGVGMLYSIEPGSVHLIDNVFESTNYSDSPVCELNIPYEYESLLDEAADVPSIVEPEMRVVSVSESIRTIAGYDLKMNIIPNPASEKVELYFTLYENSEVSVHIYDIVGNHIKSFEPTRYLRGRNHQEINLQDLDSGIYFCQIETKGVVNTRQLVISK